MLLTVLAAYLVDLERVHTLVDGGSHSVEHTSIDNSRPADTLDLLGRLDELARRHFLAFVLPIHDGLVHLGRLLPTQTMPASFLLKCVHTFDFWVQRYE